MTQSRSFRWIITLLPFLPLVLFLIPKAFAVMPEPGDYIPWYTKYTEVPWLLTALYVYPTTWLTNLIGFGIFGPVHVILMLAYAVGISFVLRRALKIAFRQAAAKDQKMDRIVFGLSAVALGLAVFTIGRHIWANATVTLSYFLALLVFLELVALAGFANTWRRAK